MFMTKVSGKHQEYPNAPSPNHTSFPTISMGLGVVHWLQQMNQHWHSVVSHRVLRVSLCASNVLWFGQM